MITDEDKARRIAAIVGPQSAAQKALNELERRRREGLAAWIWLNGKMWFVGHDKPEHVL